MADQKDPEREAKVAEAVRKIREKLAEKTKKNEERIPAPSPIYDEVYHQGVEAMDKAIEEEFELPPPFSLVGYLMVSPETLFYGGIKKIDKTYFLVIESGNKQKVEIPLEQLVAERISNYVSRIAPGSPPVDRGNE